MKEFAIANVLNSQALATFCHIENRVFTSAIEHYNLVNSIDQ